MSDRDHLRIVSQHEFPDGSETIPAAGDSRPVIKVYVRKTADNERTLSLNPPDTIPQREWLEHGWAFDGHSVVCSITPTYTRDEDTDRPIVVETLANALHQEQLWLIEWLGGKGYEVEFA